MCYSEIYRQLFKNMNTHNNVLKYNFPFSEINFQRCIATKGFNYNPDTQEFNKFMLIALVEELGEMAGAVKKLIRGFNRREFVKLQGKLLDQLKARESIHEKLKFPEIEKLSWDNEYDRAQLETEWVRQKMKKVGSEAADLLSYFDLFLTKNGIDIHKEVKDKFNQVSDEMDCKEFKL